MARRAMRDHRQAPAWPSRELPARLRREEADREFGDILAVMMEQDGLNAKMSAAREKAWAEQVAILSLLTDQELEDLDDRTLNRTAVATSGGCTMMSTIPGHIAVAWEKRRRAALSGHQRITEARERMRRAVA